MALFTQKNKKATGDHNQCSFEARGFRRHSGECLSPQFFDLRVEMACVEQAPKFYNEALWTRANKAE